MVQSADGAETAHALLDFVEIIYGRAGAWKPSLAFHLSAYVAGMAKNSTAACRFESIRRRTGSHAAGHGPAHHRSRKLKMRISHYNTFAEGGSAVLMLRLHEALRNVGHDSRIRYRKGNLQLPSAQRLEYNHGSLDRQIERICQRFETWAMVPNAPSNYGRYRRHQATPPPAEDHTTDIVHLHWINHWLDLPSFLKGIPPQILPSSSGMHP